MKQFKLLLPLGILLLLCGLTGRSQNAVVSAGTNTANSNGSISYSVGQVFFNTIVGDEIIAIQGLQQPYEISTITSIEETEDFQLTFSAYPNPVRDVLILDVPENEVNNLTFQLLNLSGTLIKKANIEVGQNSISMFGLETGIYFLRVIKNGQSVKVFRISKTQ